MAKYFTTPEMDGRRPFKCYNCGKKLILSIKGIYELVLKCSRCKADISIKCGEPISEDLILRQGELIHQ